MTARSWLTGLVAGSIVGLGALVAGALAALFGLMAIVAALRLPQRLAVIGGLLLGIGASWVALLLRADLACDVDCVSPDLTGWYALGAGLVVAGAVLTAWTIRARG